MFNRAPPNWANSISTEVDVGDWYAGSQLKFEFDVTRVGVFTKLIKALHPPASCDWAFNGVRYGSIGIP